MPDDIVGQLRGLQRYAAGLRDSIAQAQAPAPGHAEATDRSGAVRVILGPDGLPESIRVEPDWQRRLDPAVFGDAVVEAFQAAAGERMAAWSRTLHDNGWRPHAEHLHEDAHDQQPGTVDPLPPAMRHAVTHAHPRALDTLAEDMMRALDAVEEIAAASPLAATGTGANGSGHLTVTLANAGLVSCAAQPSWVVEQTAASLTTALSEALATARTDLTRATQAPNPAGQMDQLLAEALAILGEPQRLADS